MLEAQLIQELKNRQEYAFKELVETYKDKVYNTILGLVQNEPDAEDIAQEVFIQVYESIGSFRGDAKLGTWIYRIAITRSMDFIRYKNRKKRSGLLLRWWGTEDKEELQPADFHHPGIAAEQKEHAAALFKAMNKLPEKQRVAFILHKLELVSYQDIAAIMETTIASVESLMHRAKNNLRTELESYYNEVIKVN